MKKKTLTAILSLFTCFYGVAQGGLDTRFLNEVSNGACQCIDSITTADKTVNQMSKDISACIDKSVVLYQVSIKLAHSMIDPKANNTISVNTNKESDEYKTYYYEIERLLKDSCASLNKKMSNNEKKSEHSVSSNAEAIDQYNIGIKFLEKEQYKEALSYYKKAVEIDTMFAFAWDNVGVCNRKLGNWDEAIEAYRMSLTIDPMGITPLHNLPVVYELKKDYTMALQEYGNIVKVYPDDPEAYYGAGRVYLFYLVDLEKALTNMCKAYNAYVKLNSPYRVDAEKNIIYIKTLLKKEGKEETFDRILKENNIRSN